MTRSVGARFWAKVDRSGECWVWSASRNQNGYGTFFFAGGMRLAHRVAYTLSGHAIPDGMRVLHHCDNPPCVKTEPDERFPEGHLFLGTDRDNVADMHRKGRAGVHVRPDRLERGEGRYNHQLTDDAVRAIRASSESLAQLARRFGVARQTVWRVRHGYGWQHVSENVA